MAMKIKALILMITLLTAAGFAWQDNGGEDDWQLLEAREGVEFYVMNVKSRISPVTSTIIKIRNTNAFQVSVSYRPSFTCQEQTIEKEPESYFLESLDESAMQTYKICEATEPQVAIKEIQVKRR